MPRRKELGAERDGQDAGADGDVSVADSLGSWLASEDEEDGQNEHMPADGGADMAGRMRSLCILCLCCPIPFLLMTR